MNIQKYKNIQEYNPDIKRKVLIVFDVMIADMISSKTLFQIVTALIIWGKQLNISTVFITQSYMAVPKDVRLNCAHFLLWKFQTNKSFRYWLWRPCLLIFTKNLQQSHNFLVFDTNRALDNALRFRQSFRRNSKTNHDSLRQSGFIYSVCGPFTKNKERIQTFHDIFIKTN